MPETQIAYGPDYQTQVADFLGVALRETRLIAQNVYIRPTWQARKLPDGRMVWIINQTHVDTLRIYNSYAEWFEARRAYDNGYPDPETMRR